MKILTKDIVLVLALLGKEGKIFSFKYTTETNNEFYKFMKKYGKYVEDPLYSAFQKFQGAIETMVEETGFQNSFLKKYPNNNISKIRKTDNLRLYGIEISEEEILLSNGGRKLGGKRGYQTSPLLFRQVKILESLRPQLYAKFQSNRVSSIQELLDIGSNNAHFSITYEDELQ